MVRFIFISVMCSLWMASSGLAKDVVLRSHVATYEMKQVHTGVNKWSSIESAQGVLRYEFHKTCEGWTVGHHTALHMEYVNGQQVQMSWNYTSWEALDGARLRFRTRTKRNGVLVEKFTGEARKAADKMVVIYSEPNGRRENLPGDTLFPTTHLMHSLEEAHKGENVFNASFFDGSGQDLNLDVNSVFVPYKGRPLDHVQGVELARIPTWDVMLAFFQPGSQNSVPEVEVGARYRLDGVSTLLKQSFGDFSLDGKLVRLEYLKEPKC